MVSPSPHPPLTKKEQSRFSQYIRKVMNDHPNLTSHGFAIPNFQNNRWVDPETDAKRYKEFRAELLDKSFVEQFRLSWKWLELVKRTKNVNTRAGSSYHLKHVVERYWGSEVGGRAYVMNGVFIAAALAKGFKFKRTGNSPNAYFNISKKSVKALEQSEGKEFDLEKADLTGSSHDDSISKELYGLEGVASLHPVPASNRLVTLHHNSAAYKEAVEAVDAVIDAVIGDNVYGAKAPKEKEAVIGALKSGRLLLDADEVSESSLSAILINVLQYVADNFAKGSIAALGAVAVAKVLGLF